MKKFIPFLILFLPLKAQGTVLIDNFTGSNALITNEYDYWSGGNNDSADWEMTSGSFFRNGNQGWTGVPDDCSGGSVEPNATSSNCTNSQIFRLNTKVHDFKNVRVNFALNISSIVFSSSFPAEDWDGVHVWLRYQSEYNLYYASIDRREMNSVIKKKCVGGIDNGGTYYELSDYVPHVWSTNTWQNVTATVQDVGSDVVIRLYDGNTLVVTGTDTAQGCARITSPGAVGIRGDNVNFKVDSFTVTALHPRLLSTREGWSAMIASSTIHPWSDIKAGATTYYASSRGQNWTNAAYHVGAFGSGSDSFRQQNQNAYATGMGLLTLLYVLNTNNSGSITYRNKIVAMLDIFPALKADQPYTDGYNTAVPMNSCFMNAVLALDNIHDDLTAVQISSYEVMMDSYVAKNRTEPSSWALSNAGAWMTYELYRDTAPLQIAIDTTVYHAAILGNDVIYPPAIGGSRQAYHGLSSEISGSQLNVDGIHGSGSSYAWERLGGVAREKMGKWGGVHVAVFTGTDPTYTTDRKMSNFYEWLFAGMTTPWNSKVPFGDTANNQSIGIDAFQGVSLIYGSNSFLLKNAYFSAGVYSEKARQYANRSIEVVRATSTIVYPFEFIDYATVRSTDTASHPVESTVVRYGGAAFWDEVQSSSTLMGVLNNAHLTKVDHFHASGINGFFLAGYGETLLSNPGVGFNTELGIQGFSNWFHRNDAHAGSVALIGNRNYAPDINWGDAIRSNSYAWNPYTTGEPPGDIYIGNPTVIPLYGGDGIIESLLGNGFDYAVGLGTSQYVFRSTTTGAITANIGQNERNFMFVHSNSTNSTNGYWIVDDEIHSTSMSLVNVLWHPYGMAYDTTTLNQEYSWPIVRRTTTLSTSTLNIFLATPPTSISFSSSPFSANPGDFVGTYMNATYTIDASSNARVVTVLYPANILHSKSTFTRVSSGDSTGASVLSNHTTDYVLASSGTTLISSNGSTFQGRIAFWRKTNAVVTEFFVKQGRSFNDGGANRYGFSSAGPLSVHLNGLSGTIYSSGTSVGFYYPGITGVKIDGVSASGVDGINLYTVTVPSGNHDILLSSGAIETTSRGPSDALPGGFQVFPTNNVWNTRADTMPLSSSSTLWIDVINGHAGHDLHADFGTTYLGALNGIPYNLVNSNTPLVYSTFTAVNYATESDGIPSGGLPIPTDALAEGDPSPGDPVVDNSGSDRHLILVDTTTHTLWEMNQSTRVVATSSWTYNQLSKWNLDSNALRTNTWTSADAAGLPIFPGLVKYEEVQSGVINHALRFTLDLTHGPYMWPARHDADTGGVLNPPFGMRVRMKSSVDISFASPANQVIFQAMKTYGMFLADNGGDWYVSGAPNSNWDDTALHNDFITVGLPSDIFEVVDESGWIVTQNSGQAQSPPFDAPINFKTQGRITMKGQAILK